MDYSCEKAMKLTIPALRIAVSCSLSKGHKMNETDIANALGIAQAAVSKYLNGKYSKEVKRVVDAVKSEGFDQQIAKRVLEKAGIEEVSGLIERAATSKRLVNVALGKSVP
ncbi:MAG: hypothetical protein ABSA33_00595 [Candidatus Micrarchaeaceae archaeon]|jgi:predicted transcriptional regulator